MSWSELLPELLAVIARKLVEPGDYVRFRFVCSSWRSATNSLCIPPFVKIPWLILPSDPSSSFRNLYSYSEDRFYGFQLPDCAHGSNIIHGSTSGWLLVSRGDWNLYLINPFSPNSFTSENRLGSICASNVRYRSWDLSPSIIVTTSYKDYRDPKFKNITYYDGYFYVVWEKERHILICNDRLHMVALIYPPSEVRDKIFTADLAVSNDELFFLVRLQGCNLPYSHIFWMDRHEVATGKEWTEVTGIGYRAIFVDYLHCFLVEAGEATGLTKNCIYSVISKPSSDNPTMKSFYIQQFNFDDKSCQIVERKLSQYEIGDSTCTSEPSWFMPCLESKNTRRENDLVPRWGVTTFC
ncbi:F-box SKIP23-like protein (DUF295) [Rhynchospora pubera]|uniref:F-box SKIP23-like protein (DUF295) n=1 Tax=Rhynchospora pubera TaxID=906938 RepID=A0AAV8G5F5_9POAL|nr:F-box SKIP23-like protein (DUF295) [Rhynchospora pubera]